MKINLEYRNLEPRKNANEKKKIKAYTLYKYKQIHSDRNISTHLN
jgi:hypothetical protein